MKYKLTTNLTNIKRDKDNNFTYDQELLSIHYPNQQQYQHVEKLLTKVKEMNDRIQELDDAGRHRSEWVYAPYDGRKMPDDGKS